jgi:hypothetical protein
MALHDDAELRIKEGYGPNTKVDLVEGSWGKRLVRNLSILARDLTTEAEKKKGDDYTATKDAVLASLKKIYDDELATKVFRANVGHMQGDDHVTSRLHPITGRHIRKMMEQADREMLARYADPEMGGVRLGRDTSGVRAPEATAGWMKKLCPGGEQSDGEVVVDLRQSKLDIVDAKKRDTFGEIAETLFEDAEARLANEPRAFWTLDVGMGKPGSFDVKHPIGLCIDSNAPDMVQIYDGNVRSVAVPRRDFAPWLAAHLHANYEIDRVELHRARLTLDSYFEPGRSGWVRTVTDDSGDVGALIRRNFAKLSTHREDGRLTCPAFDYDVDRGNFQIRTQGREVALRFGNSGQVLSTLVEGGDDQQTSTAVHNLSVLLNQNLPNSLSDLVRRQVRLDIQQRPGVDIPEDRRSECAVIATGTGASKFVTVSRDGDNIRIDVELTQRLIQALLPDLRMLDPRVSWLKGNYSIEIPLETLRTEGGYNQMTTSLVTSEVRMSVLVDEDDNGLDWKTIALHFEDERFVSDRMLGFEKAEEVLYSSAVRDLEVVVQDVPNGMTETGAMNLSRLLSRQTATTLCGAFLRDMTKQEVPPKATEWETNHSLVFQGGRPFVEIEFRHSLPEDLPGVTLFHGGRRPPGEGRLETVVKVRVSLDELNQGVPQHYDFVHSPRLEWTPR